MVTFGKKTISNLRSKVNTKFTGRCLAFILLFVFAIGLMNFYYGYPFFSLAYITDKPVTDRLIKSFINRENVTLIDLLNDNELDGKKATLILGDYSSQLRQLVPQCIQENTRKHLAEKMDSSFGWSAMPVDHMGIIFVYDNNKIVHAITLHDTMFFCFESTLKCLDAIDAGFVMRDEPGVDGQHFPCYRFEKVPG